MCLISLTSTNLLTSVVCACIASYLVICIRCLSNSCKIVMRWERLEPFGFLVALDSGEAHYEEACKRLKLDKIDLNSVFKFLSCIGMHIAWLLFLSFVGIWLWHALRGSLVSLYSL